MNKRNEILLKVKALELCILHTRRPNGGWKAVLGLYGANVTPVWSGKPRSGHNSPFVSWSQTFILLLWQVVGLVVCTGPCQGLEMNGGRKLLQDEDATAMVTDRGAGRIASVSTTTSSSSSSSSSSSGQGSASSSSSSSSGGSASVTASTNGTNSSSTATVSTGGSGGSSTATATAGGSGGSSTATASTGSSTGSSTASATVGGGGKDTDEVKRMAGMPDNAYFGLHVPYNGTQSFAHVSIISPFPGLTARYKWMWWIEYRRLLDSAACCCGGKL